jgi:glyoxylase-like metal-dependent hydrolase (beta-lactamase superfamily II)
MLSGRVEHATRRGTVLGSKKQPPASGPAALVAEGIVRIDLPTPWAVGPVNAYLIDDDPLTLIDTGPIHGPTIDALECGLAACGRSIEQLERIVITHQHPDHWGLAQVLADRSGAEVCAHEDLGPWLADHPGSLEREEQFATAILRRHGADPAICGAVYTEDIDLSSAVAVTHPLRNGAVLQYADRRLQVLHRPGHSRSDTVLYDPDRGVMIAGDHVMQRPSVPLLSLPLTGGSGDDGYSPLAAFRASLARTQALSPSLILAGHGDPVRDPAAVIDRRLERFAVSARRIAAALDGQPRTTLEIATRARGLILPDKAFFAICEALGHLEALVQDGSAVATERDGVALYRAP